MCGLAVEYFLQIQGATAIGALLGMFGAKLVPSTNACALPPRQRPGQPS
ncbi:MAG: hypothetical protein U1F60_05940 [Planctomycetota bacterium]